ncbi:unnamed protein product [Protopolystoma xenopodis]|uniref:Uncharacterized protein n=1 Tax=Protopolystoma xenopodis TaxID=117903 RepID=A0A3S5BUJ2_9PLAT|nr:unnamed protein product [Protopolystoma xenopodis]
MAYDTIRPDFCHLTTPLCSNLSPFSITPTSRIPTPRLDMASKTCLNFRRSPMTSCPFTWATRLASSVTCPGLSRAWRLSTSCSKVALLT